MRSRFVVRDSAFGVVVHETNTFIISETVSLSVAVKLIFVGNLLAGDDGVAIRLHDLVAHDDRLSGCEFLELGVAGLDVLSYVSGADTVILIDALRSQGSQPVLLSEDALDDTVVVASQHELGIAQTVRLLRALYASMPSIMVIGIPVEKTLPVYGLSEQLEQRLPDLAAQLVLLLQDALHRALLPRGVVCTNSP